MGKEEGYRKVVLHSQRNACYMLPESYTLEAFPINAGLYFILDSSLVINEKNNYWRV